MQIVTWAYEQYRYSNCKDVFFLTKFSHVFLALIWLGISQGGSVRDSHWLSVCLIIVVIVFQLDQYGKKKNWTFYLNMYCLRYWLVTKWLLTIFNGHCWLIRNFIDRRSTETELLLWKRFEKNQLYTQIQLDRNEIEIRFYYYSL